MCLGDQRGGVMLEYGIVLSLVSVAAVLALIRAGVLLLQLFRYQQALLLLPFP
jgi:Flp pilus assembly pilin Flp